MTLSLFLERFDFVVLWSRRVYHSPRVDQRTVHRISTEEARPIGFERYQTPLQGQTGEAQGLKQSEKTSMMR